MEGRSSILFITLLLLPVSIAIVPEFSHRRHLTLFRTGDQVGSVKWGNLRRHSAVNMSNSLQSCQDWIYHSLPKEQRTFDLVEADDSGVSFTANSDLKSGDTILEFPIADLITDRRQARDSLDGLPWELHLAANLLHEVARGIASKWHTYIKCLPRYVPLPMFFTEMEMQNVEDTFIVDEVLEMRRFAVQSFDVLRGAKTGYATFSDFAWALSIVYSMSYRQEGDGLLHFLLPFPVVLANNENVNVTAAGGVLKLTSDGNVKKGNALSFYRDDSRKDAFLFQGRLLSNVSKDLFSDVADVADWFFSHYGGVNSNRYLTLKVGKDAIEMFKTLTETIQPDRFSISSDGEVDSSLICLITSLVYARQAIELHNRNAGGIAPVDFDDQDGTTWQKTLKLIARKSASREQTWTSERNDIRSAFALAVQAVAERVTGLLAGYSTDLREDEILLKAASWEGVETYAEDSCSSCRWQIEKQGRNDVLATGFRASTKALLQRSLLKLNSSSQVVPEVKAVEPSKNSVQNLKRFSDWCGKHDLSISEKLTMTLINDSSYQQNVVRGVLVSKDIEEGETLCTLALDAGLYDERAESQIVKDSWDLAALRLLQEKALGPESKWADYIAILPREMASPLYLHSKDLEEVQWLPVLRELIQVKSSIRKSYLRLQAAHFPLEIFSEYEWAVIMVHSRAFTLPVLPDDKFSHYVLMPFMDMINHHFVYQADWMSQPVVDKKLEITAKRALKQGDQLFASFGPRSNDNLFLYYGFVLANNPFDTTQIFESFKNAFSWFVQTWTTRFNFDDSPAFSSCKTETFRTTWPSVKQAIDDFEGGGTSQSREWWELVSQWADYGYQYLPYQPGPTIYASGISDPSLLTAFARASSILQLEPDEEPTSTKRTFHLEQFLACMKTLKSPVYRPLLNGHRCEDQLVLVIKSTKKGQERDDLIARISVAVRCVEVLATFPTTIEQDVELLKTGSGNPHVQLAREFRYRKKLQLEAVVSRLLRSVQDSGTRYKTDKLHR